MDFYEVLGVSSNASVNDIRRAYQNKLFKLRSEHAQTDSRWQKQTLERSRLILQAYQVLRDPVKRANYDQERRINRATGTTAYRAHARPRSGSASEAAPLPASSETPDSVSQASDAVPAEESATTAALESSGEQEDEPAAETTASDPDEDAAEATSMGEALAAETETESAADETDTGEEPDRRRRGGVLALVALVALLALGAGFFLRSSLTPSAPATETASASLDYEIHYQAAGDLQYSGGPNDKLEPSGGGVQAHVGAGSRMVVEPGAAGQGVTVRVRDADWQGSGRLGLSTDSADGPIGFSAAKSPDGSLSVRLEGSQPGAALNQPARPSSGSAGEQTLTLRVDASGAHYAVNGSEVGHSGPLGQGAGDANVNITVAASSDSSFDVGLSRVEVLTPNASQPAAAAGLAAAAGGPGQPAGGAAGCGVWGTIHAAVDWSRTQSAGGGLDLSADAAQLRGSGPDGAALGATFGPLLLPEAAAGMSMGAGVGGLLGLASSRIPDLLAAVPVPAAQSLADRLQASFEASASCGARPSAAALPPYYSSAWLQAHPATDVPLLTARGVLVVDRDSQQIIYAKNPDQPRPPASVMKIVTAMATLEMARPDDQVTVSERAAAQPPHRMGLKAGERLTIQDLLYGLLLESGNDAAEALADGLPGGREQFLGRMNEVARRMGLTHTHFVDASGISEEDATTPYEMAVLAGEALSAYPTIGQIAATKQVSIPATADHGAFTPANLNTLLNAYPGTYGLKDGNTDAAGYNLVVTNKRNGRDVMVVLLGSEHHLEEGAALLDWAYAHLPEPDGAPVRPFDSNLERS